MLKLMNSAKNRHSETRPMLTMDAFLHGFFEYIA